MNLKSNKSVRIWFSGFFLLAVIGYFTFKPNIDNVSISEQRFEKVESDRTTTNKGRSEYFFQLLRDPNTNQIPSNIRARELAFAEKLKQENVFNAKSRVDKFNFTEIGPNDVSGRTLAIDIDKRNTNIIIAGGASGGIWKSTDQGATWALKSEPTHNLSVSSVVQHPINQDTWYYSTAEFFGSAGARGGDAYIFGSGIYMSTDNGENWARVNGTEDNDNFFNTQFDFVTKVVVSPTTGTLFFASNVFGVFRSIQDGANADFVLGEINENSYVDVAVTSNGTLYATLSGSQGGVYMSTNDGVSWTDITPSDFPSEHERSVIGVSPSNEDIFYVFTDVDETAEGLSLFRFDVSNAPTVVSNDRSSGIPNFGDPVGEMNPQQSYNMVCKVLPNDPDFVILGTTNLIRSTDGFSSVPNLSDVDKYWIGGYAKDNDISQYPEHHPDQHNLIFDPNNPIKAYSTHDGGISVTNDITANDVVWETREDGYNITQFYTVSLNPTAGSPMIAGGTQDNGTPAFDYSLSSNHPASEDITSGDGSYVYLGENYSISSSQNGFLLRHKYSGTQHDEFSYVSPLDVSNQLFIHPFAVNPSDENFVAYPEQNLIWRNNQMTTLPRNTSNSDGSNAGWTKLSNVSVGNAGQIITSLEYSTSNPSGRLYFGGSAPSTDFDLAPKLFRLDSPTATDGEIDISIPNTDAGAYIHDIAVNPENGDEVIVVFSNYEVESVWYSNNAGASWTSVGGNLDGENGPSVRAAVFAPTTSGMTYFIGTSIGLFSTDNLNGSNTTWTLEGVGTINQSVVAALDYRQSDGVLAVATHGRGMFLGANGLGTSNETDLVDGIPSKFGLNQNYPNPFNPTTNINFTIPSNSTVTLKVYDISGREVASVLSSKVMSSGSYTQSFDASSLSSGTYMYRLEAIPSNGGSGFVETKTMTLIK